MKHNNTALSGVLLIEPNILNDSRGLFFELWNKNRYRDLGLPTEFAQDNISMSKGGVLRGLHFQHPKPQGKLITVLEGEIFDVAVDIRSNSPTFKKWVGVNLSSKNHQQLWIPEGFAHGFYVISASALVSYKATDFYSPEHETTLLWNDPELNIKWPNQNPEISVKDKMGVLLSNLPENKLPKL